MKLFFIVSISVTLLLSCNKRNALKKSITVVYNEVFYGYNKEKYKDDSVLQMFSKDISVGLHIPSIENSTALNEIRIYFIGPFEHRFMRQQVFSADSLVLEMYMCGMKNSNDSLFLLSKDHITISGKYYDDIILLDDKFPDGIIVHQKEAILDNSAYFVQVKSKNEVKSILVENGILDNYSGDEKIIHSQLHQIEKAYTFKFNDGFEKIATTFGSKLLK